MTLDLTTGDIAWAGDLLPAANPTLEAVALRLQTRKGTCFWDATFGSTLHELNRTTITARTRADVEDRIRSALKPLLDAGGLTSLSFEHERSEGQWRTLTRMTDARGVPLAYDVWVGVT